MLTRKQIGLIATVTPVWFLVIYLVMSSRRPEYSHLTKAISELGSLDAPNMWAWNILGYILPGLAIALLAIGLKRDDATLKFISCQFMKYIPMHIVCISNTYGNYRHREEVNVKQQLLSVLYRHRKDNYFSSRF